VVVVEIDDASLNRLGQFPWSRRYYTQLIQVLTQAQPNVIVFDLVFAESSPQDEALAQVMQQHGRVVLAQAWDEAGRPLLPHPILQQAAVATGHILDPLDGDGWVRQILPMLQAVPALSVASLSAYQLLTPDVMPGTLPSGLGINWLGPVQQMPHYSFIDVLGGAIDPRQFRQKIILVGVSGSGMNPVMTPFDLGPPASGVHLQATVISNLLQHNWLRQLHPAWNWLLLIILGPLWSVILSRQTGYRLVLATVALLLGWLGLSLVLLRLNYWIPVALPVGLIGLTGLFGMMMDYSHLVQANQRLRHLANSDDLTQLGNRRLFEQALHQEWQRARREKTPLSVLLCDIDFFKRFNDRQGHLEGDRCLYQVAQVLRQTIKRPSDVVARYGGEEFAVILPNTNIAGATQLAHEISLALRARQIPHDDSPISTYVTCSIGVASAFVIWQREPQELLQTADQALYQAKWQGRNQVCSKLMDI
jgi:diguanylate cyclase (GGDEF)-like protein